MILWLSMIFGMVWGAVWCLLVELSCQLYVSRCTGVLCFDRLLFIRDGFRRQKMCTIKAYFSRWFVFLIYHLSVCGDFCSISILPSWKYMENSSISNSGSRWFSLRQFSVHWYRFIMQKKKIWSFDPMCIVINTLPISFKCFKVR